MSIFDEPKIDCHNHVFDPARFQFSPKAYYRFTGMAIVANDASRRELERLAALRICGVTFNAALHDGVPSPTRIRASTA